MPRPLLPPVHVSIPARIAYAKDMAPAARDTFMQLCGIGWGIKPSNGEVELPPLSVPELSELFSKSPSTIYGHLAYLRDWEALRWRPSEGKTIIITLILGEAIANDSENLEYPLNTFNHLNEVDNLNEVKREDAIQKSGKRTIGSKPSKADPRTKLPAIQCVKRLTSRFPPKELYDDIIRVLGDSPDEELLTACRKEWLKRGYNPNSLVWLLEWYPAGGAPGRAIQKSGKPAKTGETWDDVLRELREEA